MNGALFGSVLDWHWIGQRYATKSSVGHVFGSYVNGSFGYLSDLLWIFEIRFLAERRRTDN